MTLTDTVRKLGVSTGRVAIRGARATNQFYVDQKHIIDPAIIGVGAGFVATGVGSDLANLTFKETLLIGGLGGAALYAKEPIARFFNDRVKPGWQQYASAAASYAAPLAVAAVAGGMTIAGTTNMHEAVQYVGVAGTLALAGHALINAIPWSMRKLHDLNKDASDNFDPSRRKFIKTTAQVGSSLLALSVFGGSCFEGWQHYKNRNKPIPLSHEGDLPVYVRANGEKMLEITPGNSDIIVGDFDTYKTIAADMLRSEAFIPELQKINAELHPSEVQPGKAFFIPTRMLRPELQDLEQRSVIDYLSSDHRNLWSLATDYTIQFAGSGQAEQRNRNLGIRLMRRLSGITNVHAVSSDDQILIPEFIMYPGRLSQQTLIDRFKQAEKDTGQYGRPPLDDNLNLNWSYFDANATRPRKGEISTGVYESHLRDIDMFVIHTTESKRGRNFKGIIGDIRRKSHAHYVIDRDGTIYPIIDPRFRANHAGFSMWNNVTYLNANSIGVEVVATTDGEENTRDPITEDQYRSLRKLIGASQKPYHKIVDTRVLGHTQVAYDPKYNVRGRKEDPGVHVDSYFKWAKIGLPDNYRLIDNDILSGRLGWNPAAVKVGRVTIGQRAAWDMRHGKHVANDGVYVL